MQVEYKVIFNRKKKLNKKGKAPITIEAYLNGQRRYFSTGVYISPNEWKVKKAETTSHVLNQEIRELRTKLEDFENNYRMIHKVFSLSDFDKLVGLISVQTTTPSFIEFFKQQLEIEKNNIGYPTWRQQYTNFTIFKELVGENLRFEDLNFALIQKFDHHLKSKYKLKPNTVGKRHAQLRKYILLAVKHDYLAANKNPYKVFKPGSSKSNSVYLNKEEIERFELLTFTPEERLSELARDMYLFCCYTGLRYSDVHTLKRHNFLENPHGLTLKFMAIKTGKGLEIPLYHLFNGKPQRIAQKYFRSDGKRLFFGMTNQKANIFIKTLAKLANIPKALTFHTSRHTFGTQMITKTNIMVVKDLMQHSDLKTTKIYLHLSNEERDEHLKKINWD